MKFIIVYSDTSTEAVYVDDHIEINSQGDRTYAVIDGEMYGNAGPVDVSRVSLARSESDAL